MDQQLLDKILIDTFTLGDFKRKFLKLKLMLQKKVYESAKEVADSDFDKSILEGINEENYDLSVEICENFIKNLTPICIYFVFVPDSVQTREIGLWLRKNLNNPRLVFEVKTDPSLIGGCAITYKGIYKDYSLKAKIYGSREKLMEEFRRYLKQ